MKNLTITKNTIKTDQVFLMIDDVRHEGSRWIVSGHDNNKPGPPIILSEITNSSMKMENPMGDFSCKMKKI